MQQDILPPKRPNTSASTSASPDTSDNSVHATAQPSRTVKSEKLVLVILVAVLVAALSAVGYLWFQNNALHKQLSQSNKVIQGLNKQQSLNVNKPELNQTNSVQAVEVSEKLPNGQTLTYRQSNENATIVWATETYDKSAGTLVLAVTDDAALHFITGISNDVLKKVCSIDSVGNVSIRDARVFYYDVKDQQFAKGQAAQCIDMLASTSNTDVTSRTEAAKVLEASQSNVKRFFNNLKIK